MRFRPACPLWPGVWVRSATLATSLWSALPPCRCLNLWSSPDLLVGVRRVRLHALTVRAMSAAISVEDVRTSIRRCLLLTTSSLIARTERKPATTARLIPSSRPRLTPHSDLETVFKIALIGLLPDRAYCPATSASGPFSWISAHAGQLAGAARPALRQP